MSVPATTAGFSGPRSSRPGQTLAGRRFAYSFELAANLPAARSRAVARVARVERRIADRAEQDRVGLARGGQRVVGQRRQARAEAPRRRWRLRADRTDDRSARQPRAGPTPRRRRLRARCRRPATTGSSTSWIRFYEVLLGSTRFVLGSTGFCAGSFWICQAAFRVRRREAPNPAEPRTNPVEPGRTL